MLPFEIRKTKRDIFGAGRGGMVMGSDLGTLNLRCLQDVFMEMSSRLVAL